MFGSRGSCACEKFHKRLISARRMVKKPRFSTSEPTSRGDVSPWALASLGAQFFAGILLFLYLGNWLDEKWSTSPLFLLSGVLLGGGGVFYSGYRKVVALQRQSDASHSHDHNLSPTHANTKQHDDDSDGQPEDEPW